MQRVTLVGFGDEVHVYDAGDETAQIVYTTAIGANLDAEIFTVTAEQFEPLRRELVGVVDHRGSE